MSRLPLELVGKKFGRLTPVKMLKERDSIGSTQWRCRCDCGKEIVVRGTALRTGHTQSCGCLRMEAITLHGLSREPVYRTWQSMIQRCHNESDHAFSEYGARGITVCKRWRESFEAFLEDVGEPGKGMTLNRLDNDKGYTPDNVEWASRKTQANNRRNNILIKHEGQELTLAAWCEKLDLDYAAIYRRITSGWPPVEALTTPVRTWRKRQKAPLPGE